MTETNEQKNERKDCFHVHHMIPKFSNYFPELNHLKEDPLYKVRLTVEGHACQHDILHKVFGDQRDQLAASMLYGQAGMTEEAIKLQKTGAQAGGWFGGRAAVKSGQLAEARKVHLEKDSKPVILTHLETGEETEYPSVNEAGRAIGGHGSAICEILKGRRNKHHGYTARYK